MKTHCLLIYSCLICFPLLSWGQNQDNALLAKKEKPTLILPGHTLHTHCNGGIALLPILSNTTFQATPTWKDGEEPWFSISQESTDFCKIHTKYWYKTEPREGKIVFTLPNGKEKIYTIRQEANHAINCFEGDKKIKVQRGHASSVNKADQDIDKTFDGSTNTFYHSQWQGGSTEFPVTLTYEFENAPHLDYIIYTPRTNHSNGRFGKASIAYTTTTQAEFTEILPLYDFEYTGKPTTIQLGENGIEQVKSIRFTVETAYKDVVSCAEMEFYQSDDASLSGADKVFTNDLYYELRPDVTPVDIDQLQNPFLRQLGHYIADGNYETKFRVGEYEAYETLASVSKRQKTSAYNRYENPTGIFFKANDKNIIFADGIDDKYPVNLIIKDWGLESDQPESIYPLKNGINIIKAHHKGNSYVSYYTDDFKVAPKISLHFAMSKINGYFDLERGDTNEDWVKMLANACSDIMDIRTQRIQAAFPTEKFKENCPVKAVELALNMDSTIYYEREVMGLARYGIEPKNRQFARVIPEGTMHADGTGAAAPYRAVDKWMQPGRSDFEFWGFAHELGHVNQVRPGLKWVGCGETTNNIYSAWVQFKLGDGFYRLEGEKSGIDDYRKIRGGRFNCYLEEGVRKGYPWQLQKGSDYSNVEQKEVKVPNVDYKGKPTGKDTTLVSVNYDHFVKLVPLWQLQLYCHQAGFSPDIYAKVCQAIRTTDESKMTDGQLQLKFMREVCDSSQLNFLPFFEKAGMLKPIRYYVQDYGPTWLNISTDMINELKQYVAAKGYPTPEGEINYISALNWECYKNKLPLQGAEINVGCTPTSHIYDKREPAVPYIKVDHNVWKNTVAFETYNKEGELIRISMHGLGADEKVGFTMVMFPETANYIMAVGWDGTRIKCYQE